MCYVIVAAIENSVKDAVNANAPTPSSRADLHDGPWDDSTMIAEDLRGFRNDMRHRGIRGRLDLLFHSADSY